jgi:hypothetical protein
MVALSGLGSLETAVCPGVGKTVVAAVVLIRRRRAARVADVTRVSVTRAGGGVVDAVQARTHKDLCLFVSVLRLGVRESCSLCHLQKYG